MNEKTAKKVLMIVLAFVGIAVIAYILGPLKTDRANARWLKIQQEIVKEYYSKADFTNVLPGKVEFPAVNLYLKGDQKIDDVTTYRVNFGDNISSWRKISDVSLNSIIIVKETLREKAHKVYSPRVRSYKIELTACVLSWPEGKVLAVAKFREDPPDYAILREGAHSVDGTIQARKRIEEWIRDQMDQ